MKVLALLLFVSFSIPTFAEDFTPGEDVRGVQECIFDLLLPIYDNKLTRRDIPLPLVRLEHETSLKEFQDAVEPQWGFRPDAFLNVYVPRLGQIFLMSNRASYKHGRSIFDSLAHELVHFIQVKYRGIDIGQFGDAEEFDAIVTQNAFREKYGHLIQDGRFVCPSQN